MKRILVLITSLTIAFALAACGQSTAPEEVALADNTEASQESSAVASQLINTASEENNESTDKNILNESAAKNEITEENVIDETTTKGEISNENKPNEAFAENDISNENVSTASIKREIEKSKIDISAYISLIDGFEQSEAENNDQGYRYGLIYFDKDDIQELFVWKDAYSSISVYTIDNSGKVICLVDNMRSEFPSYYERKGIIEKWSRWNGGGDEGSYAGDYYVITVEAPYTDARKPDFGYEYNASYDEDGKWTGTGKTEYFSKGELITEDEYEKIFEAYQISEWTDDADAKEEGRVGRTEF